MLKSGILNPAINSLLSRVRHTNTLVIADRGFPNWPQLEIIDISLVDDVPRVFDVVAAILPVFQVGRVFMADEFSVFNSGAPVQNLTKLLAGVALLQEPHEQLKKRVSSAIGLIRTGDTTPYANMILESA